MADVSSMEALDLIHLISGVNKRLEQLVGARLKPAGIPIEQFRTLSALDRRDGLTMGELAGQIFVDGTHLTKIIDRMISAGLVFRAPDHNDRRKVLVFLSDMGRSTLNELRILVEKPDERLVEGLRRGDAKMLRTLLKNLLS